ncbi:MAG: DUF6783 domain-containing protein [Anaerobutyricum hallii]|uniref:DUF6783 domain-containing protein n=1 Tax=Anaerobutyricum hallii TaxID=39488 RepID=UPI00399390BB
MHTPIYGIFCLHSVAVAHYAALIQAKSPANCDAHLAESIFQTRSRAYSKNTLVNSYLLSKSTGDIPSPAKDRK